MCVFNFFGGRNIGFPECWLRNCGRKKDLTCELWASVVAFMSCVFLSRAGGVGAPRWGS